MHSPASHMTEGYTVGGVALRLKMGVQGFNAGVKTNGRSRKRRGGTDAERPAAGSTSWQYSRNDEKTA